MQNDALKTTDGQSLKEASKRLRAFLFGHGYSLPSPGFVGFGSGEIHVYLHAKKGRWRGETPNVWEGYPVNWTFGVGKIVAALAEDAHA